MKLEECADLAEKFFYWREVNHTYTPSLKSQISLYNEWLKFKAAKDLCERGTVEHLDIDKVISDNFGDLKFVHKERKNLGMTYVYIIENTKEPKAEVEEKTAE